MEKMAISPADAKTSVLLFYLVIPPLPHISYTLSHPALSPFKAAFSKFLLNKTLGSQGTSVLAYVHTAATLETVLIKTKIKR